MTTHDHPPTSVAIRHAPPDERARAFPRDAALGGWMVVGGLLGLAAAFTLMIEKLALLADPSYTPTCSINPVLNCGSIMRTDQAEAFGFPNPILGIAAFPVVAATGAMLLAGGRLARWYWLGLQAGVTLGAAFVAWLVFQSLYRIGALCPYCMVVWAVVVPLFWYVTLRNATAGVLGRRVAASGITRLAARWHTLVLAVPFILVIALIAERFWYYWTTLV